MYIEVVGDMLASSVEGELVGIPVNCIGVAGKGLAAYMKFHLPDTTRLYYKVCKRVNSLSVMNMRNGGHYCQLNTIGDQTVMWDSLM